MYFVSTREENDHKELFGGAWGYYWDKASAVDAVHRNVTDIHETIYPYAIIECLEQGLFPVPKERQWFGWQEDLSHASAIDSSCFCVKLWIWWRIALVLDGGKKRLRNARDIFLQVLTFS